MRRLLSRLLHRTWSGLLDLVYPPRCLACLELLGPGPDPRLCAPCSIRLPAPIERCPRCARDVGPHEVRAGGCPRCVGPLAEGDALGVEQVSARDPVSGAIAAYAYAGSARELVLGLKFGRRLAAAGLLAEELAERLLDAGRPGDLIVPVPLSARRRRERGYDQALMLARAVAPRVGLPVAARALYRRRHTAPQTSLSRAGRRRSQRGAFLGRPRLVAGRAIILIDDVLTTGSTARAAALALRRAGAVRVVVAAACRA